MPVLLCLAPIPVRGAPSAVASAEPLREPRLAVRLFASHESVAPGGQIEIAVQVDLERPWHMYHPILLDTGVPTTIDFFGPPGVEVGRLRFPAPELAEQSGAEYLALEGTFVVLAALRIPPQWPPGRPLELTAQVAGLACIEQCIPVEARGTLRLNVTATPGAPANQKLFDQARQALPAPLAQAPYIEGSSMRVEHSRVPVGGSSALVATIRLRQGLKVLDRDPGLDDLIPSRLLIEPHDGLEFEPQQWPEPTTLVIPGLGRVRQHSGELTIRVPFRVTDRDFEPGPVSLRVLLHYQACDRSTCFPPAWAEAFVRFEVAPEGTPAVAADPLAPAPDDEFTPVRTDTPGEVAAAGTRDSTDRAGAQRDGGRAGQPGAPDGVASPKEPAPLSGAAGPPLVWVFVLLFIGGMILNVMPCVLPVISLKILSFMNQAGQDRGRVLRLGLVYALGIEASFGVLALAMTAAGLAWGGLMQQPAFLIGLTALVFALGLSLLGVFELRLPGAVGSAAASSAAREGYRGAFLNGILATALATPCTGPVLGYALGVLTQFPPLVAGAGILTVGLGLAAPYVVLTAFPAWLRYLPRPGPWMVVFQQAMGFVLMATVVWLLYILAYLVGPGQLVGTLALLCSVGLACWLVGRLDLRAGAGRIALTWAGALASIFLGLTVLRYLSREQVLLAPAATDATGLTEDPARLSEVADAVASAVLQAYATAHSPAQGTDGLLGGHDDPPPIPWASWRPGLPERLAARGYTVYVDFTAKWCLTCQTNKKFVLETPTVRARLAQMRVIPLQADFTRRDRLIQQELRRHQRAGVPLNIIIPANRPTEVIVLPELLTRDVVLEALQRAGPSRAAPASRPPPQE